MDAAKAIQIITIENHTFKLHQEHLRRIFECDNLKDRKAVIVSIAGAFRKGKSFLLNFFLKYLYAQYKHHNMSDWIGESENDVLIGFKSQGGPERETTGIWMWSDIFTYDYNDGSKVAIILLDTQGIFDDESTVKDCTTIFAISMMMASHQCYNVMQNIQEDDLQHLQLFLEYGRLATAQENETPFQNLLFIVRDWQYPDTYSFGFNQQFIAWKLRTAEKQSAEMRQLRERIRDNFKSIGSFLMPHPGFDVAEGTWKEKLQNVAPRFIQYVKELVPSLFAPENLIVKTINEQEIRTSDLLIYLQTYVDTFNGDTLPEPKSVLMATAEASNQILCSECVNSYVNTVEQSLKAVAYFRESDLNKIHGDAKAASLLQFQTQRKLGDDNLISCFQYKLDNEIESKYKSFVCINERQRKDHTAKEEARAEATRQAQLKVKAEAQARIEQKAKEEAQAEATRQAQLKAQAELEKIALQKKANQLEKELKKAKKSNPIGKILKVGSAAVVGVVIGGPLGAAIALNGAGDILDE